MPQARQLACPHISMQEMDVEDGEATEVGRHDEATGPAARGPTGSAGAVAEPMTSGPTASAGAATVSPYTSFHDISPSSALGGPPDRQSGPRVEAAREAAAWRNRGSSSSAAEKAAPKTPTKASQLGSALSGPPPPKAEHRGPTGSAGAPKSASSTDAKASALADDDDVVVKSRPPQLSLGEQGTVRVAKPPPPGVTLGPVASGEPPHAALHWAKAPAWLRAGYATTGTDLPGMAGCTASVAPAAGAYL